MTSWQGANLENIAYELKNIREILEKRSTSEQSSKVGEWQKVLADIGYCSVCNEQVKSDEYEDYRYCPNCGAKMKGKD